LTLAINSSYRPVMDRTRDVERTLELRSWIVTGRARQLRVNAGISQAAIGDKIGVAAATVLRWEKGRVPRGRNAREYHKVLTRLAKAEAGAS
jgi:DNA-binding XRE family transcriptional regulator